jgi:CubicO group peptidase (beta-lactamase class C family)
VYSDPATVEIMLTTIDGAQPLPDAGERAMAPGVYRMGIWVTEIEGFTAYMHTGFFGTLAAYFPELDLAIAVAVNQNQHGGALRSLASDAIRLVAEARQ